MNRKLVVLALLAALPAAPSCRRVEDKSADPDKLADPSALRTPVMEVPRKGEVEGDPARPKSAHKPLLWEVMSPAGQRNHLFGTMHLGFDYEDLPPVFWERLRESKTVVIEADLRRMAAAVTEDRKVLPPGQSLRALLGDATWRGLKESAPGIPDEMLDRIQPWMALQLVLPRLYPTALPLDLAILREAEKDRRELVFLETVEFQLDMLAAVVDARAVSDMVDDASEARALLAHLVEAYRAGNFEEISRLALDPASYGDRPELVKKVIEDRNRDWVPKLAPLFERGGTFVAVGSAHMVGEHGLLKAFTDKGYRITRVAP